MSRIEVAAGVHLYVQDLGADDHRPAVVLVPGFGMTHEAWDRQVRVLVEAGHRVIAIDQRGHGRSDKPLNGYDVARLSDDLLAVLDRLGVETCSLVGWSFGGQVAFRTAALHPDRVHKLVLVGSNAVRASRSEEFPFGRPPEPTIEAMVAMEIDDRFAARRTTISSGFGTTPDPAVVDWMTAQSLQMPSWAAIACYHSMLSTDQVADLPRVTMPVLQVIGETDPVHSAKGAAWLVERLPDSRLVTLPACGHYPMFEAPAALDQHLVDFLAP
ncbi:alpha/beta hydrolase [Nocardioides humilatus]|uniref:Alpha/beta hydrolase n=1 Tax=Nocardioides humilatus TaxID=2607660 RepID=A0A5B1LQE0_9ACTN|nr:alpha/beta hydrolase [Nocardioides humilatus]KAA1421900.1 alpha/beta hydrolase [Nocardioides humilatus]